MKYLVYVTNNGIEDEVHHYVRSVNISEPIDTFFMRYTKNYQDADKFSKKNAKLVMKYFKSRMAFMISEEEAMIRGIIE